MSPDTYKPILDLALSAGYFGQETWDDGAEQLRPYFRVGGGLVYNFGEVALIPHIICEIKAHRESVRTGVVGDALWETLKRFFKPTEKSEPVWFQMTVRIEGSTPIYCEVKTEDPEALQRAL